ncbi:MAG: transglycosylase SLT domain-containing protein [Myxococcota bacterium]|nr:transglycosylase SLT domain-containing protein [Myxococcota bacterium]
MFSVVAICCAPLKPKPSPPSHIELGAGTSAQTSNEPGAAAVSGIEMDFYFSTVNGGTGISALLENQLSKAFITFDTLARELDDSTLKPRAAFLAGYLAERLGNDAKALETLPAAAQALPLIADTAYEIAARAALRLGQADTAIALADKVSRGATVAPVAALTRADALVAQHRYPEAIQGYADMLQTWPNTTHRFEGLSKSIICYAHIIERGEGDTSMAADALEKLEALQAQAPTSRWTRAAVAKETIFLDALGKATPRRRPEPRAAVTAYEAAKEQLKKRRHKKAERLLNRVVRLARKNSRLSCDAKYNRAMAVLRQRDRKRAAFLFDRTAKQCGQPDIHIRALYRGAKSYHALGHWDKAISLYGQVETEYPTHSFADDARLNSARCHLEKGNSKQFMDLLQSLPDAYPTGDMRSEALWTLSQEALRSDDLSQARQTLTQYYELFPRETGWYAAGRSGYWLGRVEERLGDMRSATLRYEQVISSAPLTFYMVLAYSRLAALDKAHAEQLLSDLAPLNKKTDFSFPIEILADYPLLAVGVELYRLGLIIRAQREFDRLLKQPDLPPEVYWVIASLLRRAGNDAGATATTMKANGAWRQHYPASREDVQWILAFPPAYEVEVRRAAAQSDVLPTLIWAVMREESSFDPSVESWANAIGLMQLILPTARRMGRDLDITVTPRSLRNPDVNIRLGTAYLAHLKACLEDHPALVIAGYNAGEGAVARWLAESQTGDVDLFLENIPYDQTRRYTKRVIASLATYELLYGETREMLTLDLNLPKR